MLSTIFVIALFGFKQMLSLREKIFFQGSIPQRLDYWQNGIDIWKDHPIFGVGPDQFQRYAASYRSPSQIIRDGNFVIPDKSHNVLIDHLANGGAIAGILWVSIVISVFWVSVKLVRLNLADRIKVGSLTAVWTAYVAQSLISPDQIVLSVIGFTSGGLLVGIYNKELAKSRNLATKQSENPFIVRAIAATVALISFFILAKALTANAHSKQMIEGNVIGEQAIINVIDEWPNPKTTN
jgi:O-antigen ligase